MYVIIIFFNYALALVKRDNKSLFNKKKVTHKAVPKLIKSFDPKKVDNAY